MNECDDMACAGNQQASPRTSPGLIPARAADQPEIDCHYVSAYTTHIPFVQDATYAIDIPIEYSDSKSTALRAWGFESPLSHQSLRARTVDA